MPKKAAGLSARKVETIKRPGMFADGNGLYLQVTNTGAKTWIFRFKLAGRRRDMGLGSAAIVTLADARARALEAKQLVVTGVDPIAARRAATAEAAAQEARQTTFRECAEALIESKRAGWRNAKHAAQWQATLEAYAYPTFGSLPVGEIDTNLVVEVLRPIWNSKTETASRLRGRIEAVLDYAKTRNYRSGDNPARWRGHLSHILPSARSVAEVEHHASLPYVEMPKFWPRLQVSDGLGARALEFVILTAARSSEALGATWDEIQLDERLWVVPGRRMKGGKEHRVPLSVPAIDLLQKLATIRVNDFVFPGARRGRPLSDMAMAMVLRRQKLRVTPHGFRATFRTWAAEQTDYAEAVVEAALAHEIPEKVVAAYKRTTLLNLRFGLMREWAIYVTRYREPNSINRDSGA